MNDRTEVQCGPAERDNKRAVIARLGSRQHVDKFDVTSSYHRSRFCQAAALKLGLPDDALEWLDAEVLTQALAEDERPRAGVPNVVCMADVPAVKTEWCWPGHIPFCGITMADGEAGISKSLWSIDLGARLSRGDAPPPHIAPSNTFTPMDVVYLSPEDDPGATLRPRFDGARANLRRIHLLQSTSFVEGDQGREIKLPLDVEVIRQTVQRSKARVLVIDPLTGHMGDDINTNSDSSMRQALMPLNRMAQEERIAVIAVRHLAKAQGRSALNAGLGSVGIMAVARAGFLFARDPENASRIIMACSKMNLARKPKSLAYTIVETDGVPSIQWEGEALEMTADELVGADQNGNKKHAAKLEAAKAIIADLLASGPRGSNEVLGACQDAGLSERTYHAARKELGVKSEKTSFNGNWLLSLPISANGHLEEDF